MKIAYLAVAAICTLSACSSSSDSSSDSSIAPAVAEPTTTPVVTQPSADSTSDISSIDPSILAAMEKEDVSAVGVLLAAVFLSEGDAEEAVAVGAVTPAEVDEAVAAIRNGTLDQWAVIAES